MLFKLLSGLFLSSVAFGCHDYCENLPTQSSCASNQDKGCLWESGSCHFTECANIEVQSHCEECEHCCYYYDYAPPGIPSYSTGCYDDLHPACTGGPNGDP